MKQIEQLQEDFQKLWVEFTSKYEYDSQLGYLISNQHKIKCFDLTTLNQILQILPELNETGKIVEIAQSFKPIQVIQPLNFKDMVILHDTTSMIIQSYYLQKIKTLKEQEIKIPANLAQLLYLSSQYLKCNPGNITVYQYNWKIKQNRYKTDPFDLTYQDVELKWYFTIQKEDESNFFKLNFLGSFYMWKIFKQVFYANFLAKNAPWHEKQIIDSLDQASKYWEKITEQNTKMVSMMDVYFNKKLRPYISGFENVYFEKVGKRLSSSRGNTGFDPSYQLFEQALGISFKDHNPGFENLRRDMRKVMAQIHGKSIEHVEQISQLRKYCIQSQTLKEAYNRLLDHEIKFTRLHNEFIIKYIKNFSPGIQNQPPFCFVLGKLGALEKNLFSQNSENIKSQEQKNDDLLKF